MAASSKCQHPNCNCACPSGQKFCSDGCRDLANQSHLRCDCGHEGCIPTKK